VFSLTRQLHNRIVGSRLTFSDDVESILQAADTTDRAFRTEVDEHICVSGLSLPKDVVTAAQRPNAPPAPLVGPTLDLDRDGITSIISCTGYNNDFGWVKLPVFDARGNPVHTRGVSACPGIYFLGLQWMHKCISISNQSLQVLEY
jgi:putative flavoprotein involved in K+ transport